MSYTTVTTYTTKLNIESKSDSTCCAERRLIKNLKRDFLKRGYKHHTPLDKRLAVGAGNQRVFIDKVKEQRLILKNKNCDCLLHT